jgi:hypothetical protein
MVDDRSSAPDDRARLCVRVRDELVVAVRGFRPGSVALGEFADALEAISDPVELEAVPGWLGSRHDA